MAERPCCDRPGGRGIRHGGKGRHPFRTRFVPPFHRRLPLSNPPPSNPILSDRPIQKHPSKTVKDRSKIAVLAVPEPWPSSFEGTRRKHAAISAHVSSRARPHGKPRVSEAGKEGREEGAGRSGAIHLGLCGPRCAEVAVEDGEVRAARAVPGQRRGHQTNRQEAEEGGVPARGIACEAQGGKEEDKRNDRETKRGQAFSYPPGRT